jgi:hypothetical protein
MNTKKEMKELMKLISIIFIDIHQIKYVLLN